MSKKIDYKLIHVPVDGCKDILDITCTDAEMLQKTKQLLNGCSRGMDWADCDFTNNTFMYVEVHPIALNLHATILVRYLRGKRLPNFVFDQNICNNNTVIMLKGKALLKAEPAFQFLKDTLNALKIIHNLKKSGMMNLDESIDSYIKTWGEDCKSKVTKQELLDFYTYCVEYLLDNYGHAM